MKSVFFLLQDSEDIPSSFLPDKMSTATGSGWILNAGQKRFGDALLSPTGQKNITLHNVTPSPPLQSSDQLKYDACTLIMDIDSKVCL